MALLEEDSKSPTKGPSLGMTSAVWTRLISRMLTRRSPEKTLLPPKAGGAWGQPTLQKHPILLDGSKTEVKVHVFKLRNP